MAQKLRDLDPRASPAALFGAELRALRLRRGLSLARLGQLVHVSGDLLSKVEKAERRPRPELVTLLDRALEANGALLRTAAELRPEPADSKVDSCIQLTADAAAPVLRAVVDRIRDNDHSMGSRDDLSTVLGHVRAADPAAGPLRGRARTELHQAIGEAYQLAGWMSFDGDDPARAEALLMSARWWAERAADTSLVAFVLGANLSFVATYSGNPISGMELAHGALGWARRSGNRRLAAFTMAIAARAHARLGDNRLCLDLLDDARTELDRHRPDVPDPGWLSVFDPAALDGHRGSCMLDLDSPERAVDPLRGQDTATNRFLRNRVIWQLDSADAHLRLREIDRACADIGAAASLTSPGAVTPRVLRRFRAMALALREWESVDVVDDTRDVLRCLIEANA